MDNAASFIPLAGELSDFDVLALDFAGHGLSSHRPRTSRYYFAEYLFDIDLALNQMDWDICHVVGHSMGAGVATCLAAALPEMVSRLVLLDSVGVYTQASDQTARQLRASVKSIRKARGGLRQFESVEAAMLARQAYADLSDDAARLLCERALEPTGESYQWRTDPRLNWRSPTLLTDPQALDLLGAIECATLVVTSPVVIEHLGEDRVRQRLAAIRQCRHEAVAGGHHFHMDRPGQVAELIKPFFGADGEYA
jgi:pimeloyl-ACP methyl ester carboxylesterase